MTKCLVLICGPPACLKSTLIRILRLIFNHPHPCSLRFVCVKKLFECSWEQMTSGLPTQFLSFDELFLGYEKEIIENESNWKLYRSSVADEIERIVRFEMPTSSVPNLKYSSQIFERLHQTLANFRRDNLLIIEDNFYYTSMRHRYRQIAQRARIGFACIHLYSTLSTALQRNQNRALTKRVSELAIENIFTKYEFVDDELVIDTTDRGVTCEHLNQIVRRIVQACNEVEEQRTVIDDEQYQRAREVNEQNVIYQIDQRLRKLISKYLQEEFSSKDKFQQTKEKKVFAERINSKRQEFLRLIKQGMVVLDDNDRLEQIFKQFLEENE